MEVPQFSSADRVVGSITGLTTPEEFSQNIMIYPDYSIEQAGKTKHLDEITALEAATEFENVELIKHIVEKYGEPIIFSQNISKILSRQINEEGKYKSFKTFLSLTETDKLVNHAFRSYSQFGTLRTPIHWSMSAIFGLGFNNDAQKISKAVKFLLMQGASVPQEFDSTINLRFMAHRVKNLFQRSLVYQIPRIIIREYFGDWPFAGLNDFCIHDDRTLVQGAQIIQNAKSEVKAFAERRVTFLVCNHLLNGQKLPKNILKVICEYMKDLETV